MVLLGLKYDQMTGHVVSLAEKHTVVGCSNTLVLPVVVGNRFTFKRGLKLDSNIRTIFQESTSLWILPGHQQQSIYFATRPSFGTLWGASWSFKRVQPGFYTYWLA
jgi:hypothetical protein